jgi:hypothetical protein
MPKRKARKAAKKSKRAPSWPRTRASRKDERGIPLTSDRRPFTILPSDFAQAMLPPAGAPTKATRKIDPPEPTTAIPELNAIEFTPFAYQTVVEAITAASKVQMKKLNPTGGPNLRYRIELAAAFLAHVMQHAYDSVGATGGKMDPKEFAYLAVNIVFRRAEEIYGSGGA